MMSKPINKVFTSIEFARGVAATLVVLHHAGNLLSEPRFVGIQPFDGHLKNFNVGVDFFFVISGFVISWIHWTDIGHRERLQRYALRRLIRIYPPYWGILVPLIVFYYLFPSIDHPEKQELSNTLTSFFLVPYPAEPVLGVAWTLVHEIFFYFIFGILIVIGRAGKWLLAIWAASIIVVQISGSITFPTSFVFSAYNLEFLFGILCANLLRSYEIPVPRSFALLGISAFALCTLLGLHLQDNPFYGRLIFGGSASLAILGLIQLEKLNFFNSKVLPPMLGAASYSIYLVHPLALSIAIRALVKIANFDTAMTLAVLLLCAAGVGAGILYHLAVEKPLTRLLTKTFNRATIENSINEAHCPGKPL